MKNINNKSELNKGNVALTMFNGPVTNEKPAATKRYSWDGLSELFSIPKKGKKDGPYFVRGVCNGDRCNDNMQTAGVIVVDADQGAEGHPCPPVDLVTDALEVFGWEYILYTSYSHTPTEPRYRVILRPSRLLSEKEIAPVYLHVLHALAGTGVHIKISDESKTFSQPWFFPRYSTNEQKKNFQCTTGGTDPVDIDPIIANQKTTEKKQEQHTGLDIEATYQAIKSGEIFHPKLCALAAHLIGTGMAPATAVKHLQAIMQLCENKDKRWHDRYGQIKKLVSTADAKFTFEDVQESGLKPITVISCADLLSREFPPRENLLSPWLPKQAVTLVHAFRGVGKTHISIGVTCAMVTGSTFLKWKAGRPAGCLFIDGEMPAVVLQERFAQTIAMMDGDGEATLNIITPDMQGDYGMLDLATLEGQQRLEPYITDDIELIVVDNISTICRSTQENRGDTWLPMQEWALRMRARGKSVLLVHHDGKGGQQRGTSRKEDILDTVIQLKNPTDYTPDKGALFEVHFMKNRGIYGDDVKPFEAQLMDMGDGLLGWTTRSIEESTYEKVVALLNDGWSQVDIATELGIVKSAVHKHKKKAVGNGDFKPQK